MNSILCSEGLHRKNSYMFLILQNYSTFYLFQRGSKYEQKVQTRVWELKSRASSAPALHAFLHGVYFNNVVCVCKQKLNGDLVVRMELRLLDHRFSSIMTIHANLCALGVASSSGPLVAWST